MQEPLALKTLALGGVAPATDLSRLACSAPYSLAGYASTLYPGFGRGSNLVYGVESDATWCTIRPCFQVQCGFISGGYVQE